MGGFRFHLFEAGPRIVRNPQQSIVIFGNLFQFFKHFIEPIVFEVRQAAFGG